MSKHIYAVWGPEPTAYREAVKTQHPNVVIGTLREENDIQQTFDFAGMIAFYQQMELFLPTGSVYTFGTVDEYGDLEQEVYPTNRWLSMLQKPRMSPGAIQEADNTFNRLTSEHENTGNYIQQSALWRGLEYRIISQVFQPRDMPEIPDGTVIMRPIYIHIDPFMLTRLSPMHGMKRSDEVMEDINKEKPLPDNVADMFRKKDES